MTTIGVRAAEELGIPLKELVAIVNTHARKRCAYGISADWMKTNGALTPLGKDVYQNEKALTNTKSLHPYLDAIRKRAENLTAPFNRLLAR